MFNFNEHEEETILSSSHHRIASMNRLVHGNEGHRFTESTWDECARDELKFAHSSRKIFATVVLRLETQLIEHCS